MFTNLWGTFYGSMVVDDQSEINYSCGSDYIFAITH